MYSFCSTFHLKKGFRFTLYTFINKSRVQCFKSIYLFCIKIDICIIFTSYTYIIHNIYIVYLHVTQSHHFWTLQTISPWILLHATFHTHGGGSLIHNIYIYGKSYKPVISNNRKFCQLKYTKTAYVIYFHF